MAEQSGKKLSFTPVGVVDDALESLPSGKKSAIIHQILLNSLSNGSFFSSVVVVLGRKEADKIARKVEKMLIGVSLVSESSAIRVQSSPNKTLEQVELDVGASIEKNDTIFSSETDEDGDVVQIDMAEIEKNFKFFND